jgi:hypothetical protein
MVKGERGSCGKLGAIDPHLAASAAPIVGANSHGIRCAHSKRRSELPRRRALECRPQGLAAHERRRGPFAWLPFFGAISRGKRNSGMPRAATQVEKFCPGTPEPRFCFFARPAKVDKVRSRTIDGWGGIKDLGGLTRNVPGCHLRRRTLSSLNFARGIMLTRGMTCRPELSRALL